MKKILLSLGTIVTIVAPITTTIACSDDDKSSKSDGTSNIETNGDNTNGDDASNDKNPLKEIIHPLKELHQGNEKLIGNEGVNAKLVEDASKAIGFEKTDHDFIRVGGDDISTFKGGVVPLENFGNIADFNHAFAEVRPGDYIDFIFDNKNDIKDFTNRVFYDNTLNAENNLPGMSAPFDSLHFNPYKIENGKVVAAKDVIGEFQSQGVKGSKSLFNISTPKQNVVRMTFNDIFGDPKKHLEAQLLYVKGFNDSNNNGKIDLNDIQMTPTFAFDGGEMYGNYIQPYKDVKLYWFKDWSVAVHDETIKNYLTKLYAGDSATKVAQLPNPNAFNVSNVNWLSNFDATKIKDGDIVEIIWGNIKNVAKVVKEGSKLTLKLESGEQFQDMNDISGIDKNHISATGVKPNPFVPAETKEYEVTRMGTL